MDELDDLSLEELREELDLALESVGSVKTILDSASKDEGLLVASNIETVEEINDMSDEELAMNVLLEMDISNYVAKEDLAVSDTFDDSIKYSDAFEISSDNVNYKIIMALNDFDRQDSLTTIRDELGGWFNSLEEDILNDIKALQDGFVEKIKSISSELISNKDPLPSFGIVLTNKEQSIIARSGKVDIYTHDDGVIRIINSGGRIDMIFEDRKLFTNIVYNYEYDTILLPCNNTDTEVDDEKVKIITKATNRDDLAKTLYDSIVVVSNEKE